MGIKRKKGGKIETREDLRDVAEKMISLSPDNNHEIVEKSLVEIIHELQVYQIELEIQNEELKNAHLKIEQTRDEYINLYDFAPVGYFTLTGESLISQVNLTGAELLGITRNKLTNARFRKFIDPVMNEIWDRFFFHLVSQGMKQTTTLLLKRSDGAVIHTRIEGVRVEEGGTSEYRLMVSDISDLKLAEERINEANRYHRALIEASIDPFIIIGQDGKISDVNSATENITGYSREYLIGSPFSDIFTEPGRAEMGYQMVFKKGKIRDCPLEIRNTDGTRIPVLYNASVYTDNEGNVRGAFIVARDITDIKRAEDAFYESNQKLRLLTSLTRHDIFNHLSVIKGSNELMMDATDLSEIQKYLDIVLVAEERMEKILGFTREYEDFGNVSSGWQQIQKIIESSKSEVSLGKVKIINQIPEDLEVYADPIIRKVFSTLIENAIRHGIKISKIVLTLSNQDGSLVIVCQDDGIGIPEGDKNKIFLHGFGKHTGLGLFLSREILSITGLIIRENGVEGEGSRFEIIVPAGKFRYTGKKKD